MISHLEQEYRKRSGTAVDPCDEEIVHVLNTAYGTKPASTVVIAPDTPFTAEELKEFAAAHGLKIKSFCVPLCFGSVSPPSVVIQREYFIYRDDEQLQRYIEACKRRLQGVATPAEHHQALGEIFGYPQDTIDEFIRNNPPPIKRKGNPSPGEIPQFICTHALRAVYEELAKDLVFGDILPPLPPTRQKCD